MSYVDCQALLTKAANNYSLRQKQLEHFHPTLFFFLLWLISLSSQCCLSQVTHQILHTNIGRQEDSKVSQQFRLRLQVETQQDNSCQFIKSESDVALHNTTAK